jgi:hypothetical protein
MHRQKEGGVRRKKEQRKVERNRRGKMENHEELEIVTYYIKKKRKH